MVGKSKQAPDAEITASELTRLILSEDDFGHEMRVGNVYREATTGRAGNNTHFEPLEHGWAYSDPVTQKNRQFDYRIRLRCQMAGSAAALWLAVECKNLHKESPLIVCGTNRTKEEAFYMFIQSSHNENHGFNAMNFFRTTYGDLYKNGEFVGKSLVRVKRKNNSLEAVNDSDVWEKWSQAESSAVELLTQAGDQGSRFLRQFKTLVLPVVVVPDRMLWRAHYALDGGIKTEPVQTDECEYFIGKPVMIKKYPFIITHVHFVTITGFQSLIHRFANIPQLFGWDRYFPAGSERVYSMNLG